MDSKKVLFTGKLRQWRFRGVCQGRGSTTTPEYLCHLAEILIRRHIKIRSAAAPYDPEFAEYWQSRKENQGRSRNSWYVTAETAL